LSFSVNIVDVNVEQKQTLKITLSFIWWRTLIHGLLFHC